MNKTIKIKWKNHLFFFIISNTKITLHALISCRISAASLFHQIVILSEIKLILNCTNSKYLIIQIYNFLVNLEQTKILDDFVRTQTISAIYMQFIMD